MYLSPKQGRRYVIFDIETDGLNPTQVWVMCWEDAFSHQKGQLIGHDAIKAYVDAHPEVIWVGHNVLKFDIPALNSLVGTRIGIGSCVDTLILSTLYSPSISGGHSLSAWGERLGGERKVEHEDWSRLSSDMIVRCESDVRINKALYLRLVAVMKKIGFSEKTCEIQHKFTNILRQQQKNGFCFDGPRAVGLLATLRARESELENEIRAAFGSEEKLAGTYVSAFRRDGTPTQAYTNHLNSKHRVELLDDGGFKSFDLVQFNIGSPKQRAEKLLALGWVPDEFTPPSKSHPKGQPKVTEKGLIKFAEKSGVPEVALITKWMAINGRANMINTWLDNWNEEDGCIHGQLFVADTLRLRHQKPNTANIPAVRLVKDSDGNENVVYGEAGYYTYETRDLWVARPGRVLVGTDAAGLELRMLAHYINRDAFTDQVVNGDPHTYNANLVGIPRPKAKTLLYAAMYGAGAGKVASIMDCGLTEGGRIRTLFLDRLGITDVMKVAQKEQSSGRIELLDGAKIICPSSHAALNYKLQGGGARVMALALVILNDWVRRKKLDVLFVGNIHDEIQADVLPDHADEYGELAVEAIAEAGRQLNLNLPLTGTSKKGNTWSETH